MAESSLNGQYENEWELSKENILPLRRGRVISDLTPALCPSADHMAMVKQQRQEFEIELMTYKGDDPLDVWTRYISWLEQTFPKGGKESPINEVLQKFVTTFKGDNHYDNDPRYLTIWIKFAYICKDPLDIFTYLYDNKIGYKLASFYEAWASELERVGNTKKADLVYLNGIENGAEPLELLRQRQCELHKRIARRVAGEIVAPPDPVRVVEEPSRHAFATLKGRRSGTVAPIERASTRAATGVRLPQNLTNPVANHREFQILNDENVDPSSLMQSTGEWHSIPTKANHKENTQNAGVWTKGKVKQRNTPVVKLNEITSVSKPEFSVYTEDDMQPTASAQAKSSHDHSVLSAKKPERYDPFYHFKHTVTEPGITVMYPKDKVYCSGLEFQLEEIRAFQWLEKQRQAEMRRLKEEIEREREELRIERERFRKEREMLEHQLCKEKELVKDKKTEIERQQLEMKLSQDVDKSVPHRDKIMFIHDNKSVPSTVEASLLQASIIDSTAELLGLNNLSDSRTGSLTPNASNALPDAASGDLNPTGSFHLLSDHGIPTTLNSGCLDGTQESMTATIHTKQALSTVLGMFNQTLDLQSEFGWKANDSVERMETEPAPEKQSSASRGCQFKIFEENCPVPAEDKENWPLIEQARAGTAFQPLSSTSRTEEVPSLDVSRQRQLSVEMTQQRQPSLEMSQQGQTKLEMSQQRLSSSEMSQNGRTSLDISRDRQLSSELSQLRVSSLGISHHSQKPLEMTQQRQLSMEMSQHKPPSLETSHHRQASQERLQHEQQQQPLEMSQRKQPSSETSQHRKASLEVSQCMKVSQEMSYRKQPFLTDAASDVELNRGVEMEGVEILPSEMTFLPSLSSTRNFTGLLQNGPSSLLFEDTINESSALKMSRDSVKSDNNMENVTNKDSTKSNETKSADGKTSNVFNHLSPIIECSDEDVKTQVTMNSTAYSTTNSATSTSSSSTSNLSKLPKMAESLQSTSDTTATTLSETGHCLNGNTYHSINIDNYQPPENDNNYQKMLDRSIAIDPFDTQLMDRLLAKLPHPLSDRSNYHSFTQTMPAIVPGKMVSLGNHRYQVKKHLAQGAFAKVFLVERKVIGKKCQQEILKVQKPACPWEFYICTELQQRLKKLNLSRDVTAGVMTINEGYFFTDGSCMTNSHHEYGTLLDLVNMSKCSSERLPSEIGLLLVLDLLYIVEMMHKCHIIHGDIKPDNILIFSLPEPDERCKDTKEFLAKRPLLIKLIDFGQSIDMKVFPEGTTFTGSVRTSGFQCIEMKTNRPWTYQTDLFCLAGTIHLIYFRKYMNIYQCNGVWKMTSKFRGFPESEILQKMFSDFMSIPSCSQLPDLSVYRRQLEEVFIKSYTLYLTGIAVRKFKEKLKQK